MNKNNFVKNLNDIIKFDHDNRIIKIYGFCGGESIGYLKYLKNKYNFKSNPKVINFIHNPITYWAIYQSDYRSVKSQFRIFLNYPGTKIHSEMKIDKDGYYKMKKKTKFINYANKNNIEVEIKNNSINELKIDFYSFDKYKKIKLEKSYNIIKSSSENRFEIDNGDNKLKFGEKDYFIKVILKDGIYSEKLNFIFSNRIQINDYEVLDNYNNCYLTKKW